MKKILLLAVVSACLISCNKEEDCVCKKYRVTSNGNLLPDGETSMQNCDGVNPSPLLVTYKKECN
ncbi:hypothetical protein [Flavobacterium terrigena]|uniref:Uncharacterized protein n=1 Tax=Flavobacterium terrigena TaxID=402734 RepID=A0A1H6STR3_9FLAO|nr:hypothetical protein [Flavobacterium terrigena]SEI71339.1 hypothetical protein SAMN05660918_1508 [Flavobacterium terrigena]